MAYESSGQITEVQNQKLIQSTYCLIHLMCLSTEHPTKSLPTEDSPGQGENTYRYCVTQILFQYSNKINLTLIPFHYHSLRFRNWRGISIGRVREGTASATGCLTHLCFATILCRTVTKSNGTNQAARILCSRQMILQPIWPSSMVSKSWPSAIP